MWALICLCDSGNEKNPTKTVFYPFLPSVCCEGGRGLQGQEGTDPSLEQFFVGLLI